MTAFPASWEINSVSPDVHRISILGHGERMRVGVGYKGSTHTLSMGIILGKSLAWDMSMSQIGVLCGMKSSVESCLMGRWMQISHLVPGLKVDKMFSFSAATRELAPKSEAASRAVREIMVPGETWGLSAGLESRYK